MLNSRKNSRFALATLMILALGLSSCVKDLIPEVPEEEQETTQENTVSTDSFQFDNGDGICAAVISTTSFDAGGGMTFDIEFGTAVSAFTNDNWTSFVGAGAITCEAEALEQQENNSYVHMYSYNAADPNDLGLEFGNNATWSVAGGNGVPAFDYTTTIDFPEMGTVTGDEVVDSSSDYTINISFVTGADSLIVQVSDVLVTVPGTTTSYTFTPAQMADITTGANIAQVAAYKIEETDQSGKTIHFINERVKSYSVTVE